MQFWILILDWTEGDIQCQIYKLYGMIVLENLAHIARAVLGCPALHNIT